MPASLSIRNVPDEVHAELAARAARVGKSLQEYMVSELARLARRPSFDMWLAGVQARKAATGSRLTARAILTQRAADRR
jgi:antitoxin FitA